MAPALMAGWTVTVESGDPSWLFALTALVVSKASKTIKIGTHIVRCNRVDVMNILLTNVTQV
jgi:hypothetical protein